MTKTILITGATDGIGLLTAKRFAGEGHKVLIHGRNEQKLKLAAKNIGGDFEVFQADFSDCAAVSAMADAILARHGNLDVLINNAGVFKTDNTRTKGGHDVRFIVNTIAPYILTTKLLPIMPQSGRVINLSSAAQARVNVEAMRGKGSLDHMGAYAQSKLAITIWTQQIAKDHPEGPLFLAVNPGSLLASKMVKEGFGIAGNDLSIGVDILHRASFSQEFAGQSGQYFDNDSGCFTHPDSAALDEHQQTEVMIATREMAATFLH